MRRALHEGKLNGVSTVLKNGKNHKYNLNDNYIPVGIIVTWALY
jgi:hypothetical protein